MKKKNRQASIDGPKEPNLVSFLRTCPFSFPPSYFDSTNMTIPTPTTSTASSAASIAASEEAE